MDGDAGASIRKAPPVASGGANKAWLRALETTGALAREGRILAEVFERLADRYGDAPALLSERESLTYRGLAERSRAFLRRDTLAALLFHYAAHHADPDGKLRAQFETLYLTGWAPHESQQKPLAPGSAKTRLADALKP